VVGVECVFVLVCLCVACVLWGPGELVSTAGNNAPTSI